MPNDRKPDLYARVTNQVIAVLEEGVRPWVQPWNTDHLAGNVTLPLRANGLPYSGMNVLLLWMAAMANGYASNSWMTYRQASELGAQVRKGEKGAGIIYADKFTRKETDGQGEEQERQVYFLKSYTVFNVEQIDALPEQYHAKPAPLPPILQRIEAADAFFAGINADIRHGGTRAYYTPVLDYIQLPPFEAFKNSESYYATKAHEFVHWTKHRDRLNRDFEAKRKGDAGYAREELVAELGAAFLCAELGLEPAIREDHAPYLQFWLGVLREDHRAIFQAAAHAQRAVDFLRSTSSLDSPGGKV
jgi:antirestriction protein ArdC